MSNAIILSGARIFRHEGDLDLPPFGDLLIEGERIVSIAPPGALSNANPAAKVIDLSEHLLIPGFINAHYHSYDLLAKGCFEALPLEQWSLLAGSLSSRRSLEEIRLRTLLGAVEALRNGITTVQDFCIFAPFEDAYVDTILDAYLEAGIRVIFSIALRDRSQMATTPWAKELVPRALQAFVGDGAADPETQLAFVERQLDRIGDRGGMVIWALSPSAPHRCSPELLRGIARLADRHALPVYTHVYETRAQRVFAAREFGDHEGSLIRYMESCGLLGPHVTIAHGVWPDPAEIEMLARSGTGVVLNILSNLKLRSGVAPIEAYRRLRVPLALGCDNCTCSDVQSMFQVMKLYALLGGIMNPLAAAPTAAEALSLATKGGARSAGRADRLGGIEPGMYADLVALDLRDPAYRPLNSVARQLVFAETGRSIRHVWVNGRQVIESGRSVVDESRMMASIGKLMPKVLQEIESRRNEAAKLKPVFDEIQRRAWDTDLAYTRYLQHN